MPRNIVICSDGTGNSAIKGRGTNVFHLYEMLDRNGGAETAQIAFYDDGVGTQSVRVFRVFAGAFGWGLARNVRQAYLSLCRAYRPGDQIYLFGFSRGAFGVRTLGGLITSCGIIDRKHWQNERQLKGLVKRAYRAQRMSFAAVYDHIWRWFTWFRRREDTDDFRGEFAIKHALFAPNGHMKVRFVGVWDTVDAVGFPIVGVATFWNTVIHRFKFPNYTLSDDIDQGCHALSIDDERRSFHPLLWQEHAGGDERIEQVWFAGVHSNVGGGYPKHGMSLVTLDWMLERASAAGLRFVDSEQQRYQALQNEDDKLYNSRSFLSSYYRYAPRNIGELCEKNNVTPTIHVSAIRRNQHRTDNYAPGQFPSKVEIDVTRMSDVGQPSDLVQLANEVNKTLAAGAETLEVADRLVSIRKRNQEAFYWVSALLYVAAWYFSWGAPEAGPGSMQAKLSAMIAENVPMIGSWIADNIIRGAFAQPWLGVLLLIHIPLFFGFGWFLKTWMNRIYTRFWQRA